jgi:predicted ATPase
MIPSPHPLIVLTGGPGGGKTTLIEQLSRDPAWVGRSAALPEAISLLQHTGISPQEKLFQRAMVTMQLAVEDGLVRALEPHDRRLVLCHRGALDPLAYWLDQGWAEEEFFAYTQTTRESLYQRYSAVLHLVTAADGAAEHYTRWPAAHRPEQPEDAIRLDKLLQRVWGGHPNYYYLGNAGKDWAAKSKAACEILEHCWENS